MSSDSEASSILCKLPKRKPSSNKSSAGKVWLIAGSDKFPGAGILAALAAARVGAGYVGLSQADSPPVKWFEPLIAPDIIPLKLTSQVFLDFHPTAVALGPGIGRTRSVQLKLRSFIKNMSSDYLDIPIVLDADGLLLLKDKDRLLPNWILTPHAGELSRLLSWPVEKINSQRVRAVKEAVSRFGSIMVLKGHETLVAMPSASGAVKVWKNTSGNPALAKAGTGDVLTGIIAGFLAQGLKPWDAARLGVWLHGDLADQWLLSGHDELSLLASDLVQMLPRGLMRVRRLSQNK